jgi:hypothetical protein
MVRAEFRQMELTVAELGVAAPDFVPVPFVNGL